MKRLSISLILLMSLFALPIHGDFFLCIGAPQCNGSDNADLMVGDDTGNDIRGEAGNDVLFGNASSDTLQGQDGDDVIFGGRGIDTITAGPDNDTIFPGPDDEGGFQISTGEAGNDRFIVLAGETINCQQIIGGPEIDELHLIGFGPYVVEYPYGATPPFFDAAIVIQDPATGGLIFVLTYDNQANIGVIERITGLPTPDVTVLPLAEWIAIFQANC